MLIPILITIAAVIVICVLIWAFVTLKAMKTSRDIMKDFNDWDK